MRFPVHIVTSRCFSRSPCHHTIMFVGVAGRCLTSFVLVLLHMKRSLSFLSLSCLVARTPLLSVCTPLVLLIYLSLPRLPSRSIMATLLTRNPLFKLTSSDLELIRPSAQKPARSAGFAVPPCVSGV